MTRSHCLRFSSELDLDRLRADRRERSQRGELPVLLESQVLPAVLGALEWHPKVAFVWRQNSGVMRVPGESGERYITFAFEGCSDIIGMLKDGRFLAVEVKRPGGKPTLAQARFLAHVQQHGGVAFVARGVDDVWRELKAMEAD